jgi:ribosomal protein L15E
MRACRPSQDKRSVRGLHSEQRTRRSLTLSHTARPSIGKSRI